MSAAAQGPAQSGDRSSSSGATALLVVHQADIVRVLPSALRTGDAGHPTLFEIACRFFAQLHRAPRTLATYKTALQRFWEYLASEHVDPNLTTAELLQEDVIELFVVWLERTCGRQLSRNTLETYARGVLAFFRFAIRRHLMPPRFVYQDVRDNLQEALGPKGSYRSPRVDRRLPHLVRYVTSLDLPSADARGGARRLELLRDRALLRVLFCTGVRRAEAVSLSRADIDAGQAIITGKGNKERLVFFDEPTLQAIRAYLDARGDDHAPLFLRHDNRRGRTAGRGGERWRLSRQSVWAIVKRYAKLAGVPGATTHDFRHFKATMLLNHGMPLDQVQDILGHASPDTTKRIYAQYDKAKLRREFFAHNPTVDELIEAGPVLAGQSIDPASPAAPRHPGGRSYGQRNGHARLTEAQVAEIHARWNGGAGETQRQISVSMGIAQPTVSRIVTGTRWPHMARS